MIKEDLQKHFAINPYSAVEDFQIRKEDCPLFFIPSGETVLYS
jgi:hypothetical protein